MIKISVYTDISGLVRKMDLAKRQVPFATALALTKTAQGVKTDLVAAMSSTFEQPTSYTLGSLQVGRATKADPVATVGVKGGSTGVGAIRYLRPEVYGGERAHAIDALLRPIGLPPAGMYAVPGKAAKLSGARRIDISWLRSLVADIGEQGVVNARGIVTRGSKGSKRRKGQGKNLEYFVLTERWGKLLPGIYGRRSGRPSGAFPLVIFVRRPKYRAKFDFYGIATRAAVARFPAEFRSAVDVALATAR